MFFVHFLLVTTQVAFAQTPPPEPPQRIDEIVVTGSRTVGDVLGTTGTTQEMGFWAWLWAGFASFISTPTETVPTVPLFVDLIKADKRFCKQASESCTPGWSSRMTLPGGVCTGFGGSVSVCASAVGIEAAVNDCANTSPC